jgi:hypothetical protein
VRTATGEIPAGEINSAGIGSIKSGNAIDQGRFAGAIRPDEPDDFAFGNIERDIDKGT